MYTQGALRLTSICSHYFVDDRPEGDMSIAYVRHGTYVLHVRRVVPRAAVPKALCENNNVHILETSASSLSYNHRLAKTRREWLQDKQNHLHYNHDTRALRCSSESQRLQACLSSDRLYVECLGNTFAPTWRLCTQSTIPRARWGYFYQRERERENRGSFNALWKGLPVYGKEQINKDTKIIAYL